MEDGGVMECYESSNSSVVSDFVRKEHDVVGSFWFWFHLGASILLVLTGGELSLSIVVDRFFISSIKIEEDLLLLYTTFKLFPLKKREISR